LLFPLALRAHAKDDKVLVRTLLAVDEAKQSMTFAGDLPQGSLVQLMKADYDRLIGGASGAAQSAKQLATAGTGATLALAISCVGRRLVLGERTEEEVEAVLDVLPKGSQIVGFYSYGEISPYASGQCDLHNQTMTLTTLSESPTPLPRAAAPAPERSAERTSPALPPIPNVPARPAPAQAPPPRPSPAAAVSPGPSASAKAGNGAALTGNGKAAHAPIGSLDLDGPSYEPGTPRGGTVKLPMRGFRVESFAYDAARGKWSVPGMPLGLDSEKTLIVAFGAPELLDQPKPFQELRRSFPRSKLVGCSSAGEIAGTSVRDHSLSVAIARFEQTELATASLQVSTAAESYNAGQSLAKQLQKPALRAVFVLSEGLNVNGSELVRGLNSTLDPSVVVTGGLSGDGTAFKRTWVALGDKLQSGLIVAVGFYGDHLVVGHGSKGGWDKFGPERVVTKSTANVLFELDNKPALALYKEYLGDKASGLPATGLLFPLALRAHAKDDKVLVRTLLAVDEAKQSMTFAGDLPQGSLVQLMKADYDRLIGGASGAAQSVKQMASSGQGGTLAVAISCVGRRLVLGERTEEEVEAVLDVLPQGSQIVGSHPYGEISPHAPGQCDLHNQTMTLTTFSESPAAVARPAPAPVASAHGTPTNPGSSAYSRRPATATPMPPPPTHAGPPTVEPTTGTSPGSGAAMTPTLPLIVPNGPDLETVADARPVRLTVTADPAGGLSFSKKLSNGVQVVSFAGRLSEQFQGARVGAELSGTVVLDLSGISRITSFGVREWLQMLQEAENRVDALYLARCSEAVSNQLTMIRRFAGKGQVVSFYAPYLCSGCGTAFGALVDCVRDAESLRAEKPPDAFCPRCAKPGNFDDDPRTYLTFGGQAARVPEDVRRAISSLDPEVSFESLEKRIDGDTTRVRVASALDGALRWTRVLEGVEGDVSIDLSGVPSSTPEGMQHLLEGVGAVDTEVRVLKLEGVPTALLASMAEASLSRPKLDLISARVEGYCISCQATRPAEMRLDGNLEAIAKGQLPELTCKRCHGPLNAEAAQVALRSAAKTLLKRKRPAAAAPMPAGALPMSLAARTSSPPRSRTLATAVAVVLAIVVLGGGAAVLTMRLRPGMLAPGTPSGPTPAAAQAPGAQAQPPAAVPVAAAAPNGWRAETGLLPGWADNPV
ncbi:MAG TPA: FIST C-terminal domain-containing protein, partial [Myxococcaceae bacterium]